MINNAIFEKLLGFINQLYAILLIIAKMKNTQPQKILSKKSVRGKPYYRIKWQGQPRDQSTWQTPPGLQNYKEMINQYQIKNWGIPLDQKFFNHNLYVSKAFHPKKRNCDKKKIKEIKKIGKSKVQEEDTQSEEQEGKKNEDYQVHKHEYVKLQADKQDKNEIEQNRQQEINDKNQNQQKDQQQEIVDVGKCHKIKIDNYNIFQKSTDQVLEEHGQNNSGQQCGYQTPIQAHKTINIINIQQINTHQTIQSNVNNIINIQQINDQQSIQNNVNNITNIQQINNQQRIQNNVNMLTSQKICDKENLKYKDLGLVLPISEQVQQIQNNILLRAEHKQKNLTYQNTISLQIHPQLNIKQISHIYHLQKQNINNHLYLIQYDNKQLLKMTTNELLQKHPQQFVNFLQNKFKYKCMVHS